MNYEKLLKINEKAISMNEKALFDTQISKIKKLSDSGNLKY